MKNEFLLILLQMEFDTANIWLYDSVLTSWASWWVMQIVNKKIDIEKRRKSKEIEYLILNSYILYLTEDDDMIILSLHVAKNSRSGNFLPLQGGAGLESWSE